MRRGSLKTTCTAKVCKEFKVASATQKTFMLINKEYEIFHTTKIRPKNVKRKAMIDRMLAKTCPPGPLNNDAKIECRRQTEQLSNTAIKVTVLTVHGVRTFIK